MAVLVCSNSTAPWSAHIAVAASDSASRAVPVLLNILPITAAQSLSRKVKPRYVTFIVRMACSPSMRFGNLVTIVAAFTVDPPANRPSASRHQ
jgi:hypothetical protein